VTGESSNQGLPPTPSPEKNYWTPRRAWDEPKVARQTSSCGQPREIYIDEPRIPAQSPAHRRASPAAKSCTRGRAVGFDEAAFLACVSPPIAAPRPDPLPNSIICWGLLLFFVFLNVDVLGARARCTFRT